MTNRYVSQSRLADGDKRLDLLLDNRRRPTEQRQATKANRRKLPRRPLTEAEQQFLREAVGYDEERNALFLRPDRPVSHFTSEKSHRNWMTKIFRGEPDVPQGAAIVHPYTRNDGTVGEQFVVPIRFVGMPHHPEPYNRRLSMPSVIWFFYHGYWPRGKILRADRANRDAPPNFHPSNLYSTDPADVTFR